MAHHDHGKGMLVLIGGLLVVSFLYFVSVLKKDDEKAARQDEKSSSKADNSQKSDVNNMECSRSNFKFVCSICGSRTMTIKIEEKVEESTTTTCEIIEDDVDEDSRMRFNYSRRVPFPEAGVDIVDRKLKNTEESLEKELYDYRSGDDDILTYTESWTENWLFRKKENNNNSPRDNNTFVKPVAMFVPNTSAKYRALIGDRNVDEISDLSDCSNDSDLEEDATTTTETTTRRKVGMAKYIYDQRRRVFIDGKSKHHIDEELCAETKTEIQVDELNNANANLPLCPRETDAKEKNVSQETTTTFNSAALNDVTNEKPSNSAESNRSYYRSELFIETHDVNQNSRSTTTSLSDDKLSDIDFNLFSPPKPGTIADREHRKWQTAVPMENNPYSEENLQKRLMEKKYTPKYSSASSLLGTARINGKAAVVDSIDFETMDLSPEKSSCDNNNTPIMESSESKSIVCSLNFETMNLPEKSNNTQKAEIIKCKSSSSVPVKSSTIGLKSNDAMMINEKTKNKSIESKCTNGYVAIEVTKKNASTINEVDYSSSDTSCCSSRDDDDDDDDEKISLPSVKKLVEIFSQKQRDIIEQSTMIKPKVQDKNTSDSEQRSKFKRVERTLQASSTSPRPLHLHSLTARSLSKEFREGLR